LQDNGTGVAKHRTTNIETNASTKGREQEWKDEWPSSLTGIRSATAASVRNASLARTSRVTPVRQFASNLSDRCVERLQLEGLDEHRRLHSLEEKFYLRIILVTGEENEPLTSSRADPRHGPVKVLAPDFRHHHVANDQIEGILENLAQTL